MKDIFGPMLSADWVSRVVPERFLPVSKKTPWYRQNWQQYKPLIAGVMVAPFALFVAWKGVIKLRSSSSTQPSE